MLKRRVFIFTASRDEARRHYNDTIMKPLPEGVLKNYIPDLIDELKERLRGASIYAWGATPGPNNIRIWKKMRGDDYVIAYQKRRLKGLYRIVGKIHNEKLSERLWGRGENPDNYGKTWEYIYFLDRVALFDIASPRTFRGHSGPLSDKDVERVGQVIPSSVIKELLAEEEEAEKSDDDLRSEIEQRIKEGSYRAEDTWTKRKQRIGTSVWRKLVLENFGHRCCVCGLAIPELLMAAHIRRWADDIDNRLNPGNGLCLCPTHHGAFDKGIISIDKSGMIHCDKDRLPEQDEATRKFLLNYDGRSILKPRKYDLLLN